MKTIIQISFFFLLISLTLVVLSNRYIYSQVTQEWVAHYNNGSSDNFPSITVDDLGNVYIAGVSWTGFETGSDYAIIKYNSDGIEQWARTYNGPENGQDIATSIAVDGSGNVYVTGWSMGNGTGYDYATIKYNSEGIQQWVQRYNGPGNSDDYASSITTDNSGNVYVTGGSGGDFATIKYNSEGAQQWAQRYNNPANGSDAANSIAVDGFGNVYVTGFSRINASDYDYATVKYNSEGIQQWVQMYDGPGNSEDRAGSIAVGGSGNIYVTGFSAGNGTDYDYATIKYNAEGIEQWVQRYNGPGNSWDEALGIAVDGSDNVYVTGWSLGSNTDYDYATIKYNSNGIEQWVQRYNGTENGVDIARSIAIDDWDNVYVFGSVNGWFDFLIYFPGDYGIVKYNAAGVEQWVTQFNGDNGNYGSSIATDDLGNVYVTGFAGDEYATIKYSQEVISVVTSQTLFSVAYKDGNGWVAVGQEGTITGTKTKWSDTWFQGVSFSDANNGFAAGWHEVIFRTTDGGDTWAEQTSGTNHIFYEVSSTDENTATAVGSAGTIRRTTDGGQTWSNQLSATSNHLYGVSFSNFNNGTVVGAKGTIRRTFNGGSNWVSQVSGTTSWLYGVSFTDSSTGTAVGWNGTIIRTTDAGATWTTQNSGTMQWLNGVHFINSNIGTAVGCGGTILRTTDGGKNWIHQVSGTNSILFSVSFADINNGVAVGEGGTILTTSDGGQNWFTQSGSSQVQSHNLIHDGVNRNYFVFLPQNYAEGSSLPVVINLHGSTHYSLEFMYLTNMNPVADTAGFVAVYPNSVAGDWNDTPVSNPDDVGFIEALINTLAADYDIDIERVYISGFSNGARMTNKLGCMLSDKIAAIAPVAGGMRINCNSTTALPMVYQHGTHDASVTYNEGQSALNFWIQNNNATAIIDTVELPDIDPDDGSTVTKFTYRRSSGEARVVFYKINNGGHQWAGSPLTLPNNSLKNMDINTSAEIWNFVKDFVNKPTGIKDDSELVPETFELSQNYPNPFNPSTTISWQSPASSHQTLKVYDLLGREVATLVDDYKPAGKYEISFDGSNLASGVYLYKLTAEEYTSTKKLLLLK